MEADSSWAHDTVRRLQGVGGRVTRQRREILAAIDAAAAGVSAEELVATVSARLGRPARSTVYRTLETLRAMGAIDIVHPTPEHHRYLARRTPHQHHIVCESCGRVAVVDGCEFYRVIEAIESKTGFDIGRHTLEVFGRCAECLPPTA